MNKDTIYRQDAVEVINKLQLNDLLSDETQGTLQAAKSIIQSIVPSANVNATVLPSFCHDFFDCISRQAAIDALNGEMEITGRANAEVVKGYVRLVKDRLEALPSAQPEQRWITVTERLPEYDKPVLLSTAWGKTEIGFWTQRGWMIVACSYREFEQGAVKAWMPLPEPYKDMRGGENE